MLVPTSISTGMPFSARAFNKPMWLRPRADPPPSTTATVGRSRVPAEALPASRRKRRMTLSVAARCRFASAHAAIQEASAAGQQAHGCRPDGGGRAPDAWGHLRDSLNLYWAEKNWKNESPLMVGRPALGARR